MARKVADLGFALDRGSESWRDISWGLENGILQDISLGSGNGNWRDNSLGLGSGNQRDIY